ncbi:acyl-CoA N-acyltransferase [Syncephalis plumigaleata]|nr:acyl-CoA N-acyltransferase [Syncephalis plumigaleata]
MSYQYAHINGMRKAITPLATSDAKTVIPSIDVVLVEIQRLERKTFPRSEHTWPGDSLLKLNSRQHILFAFMPAKEQGLDEKVDATNGGNVNNTNRKKGKKASQSKVTHNVAPLNATSFPLVGYITLQLDPSRAQIVKLAVNPDYRGCGVGTALVKQATLLSISLGRQRCELHVDPERESAYRLYQRCEFKEHGIIEDYYGTGRNAITLRWQAIME